MLNRIAEIAGRIVILSGILFVLAMLSFILDMSLGWFVLMRYAMAVMFGALIVGGAAAVLRFALSTFGSAQIRLQELLATLFAGATAASIAAMWVKSIESDPVEQTKMVIQYTAASLALFFTGSAWSWTAARRLGENSPRERFKLMVTGWIVCAGGMALTLALTSLVAVVLARPAPEHLKLMLLISAPFSLLIIPGIFLERRCRRAQREAAAKAAVAAPALGCHGATESGAAHS